MGTAREFVATVKKRKLQYFEHVIRAQNLCTHILDDRIDGRRTRGRPRRRRLDNITIWTRRPIAVCTAMARDRYLQKTMVHESSLPDPQQ